MPSPDGSIRIRIGVITSGAMTGVRSLQSALGGLGRMATSVGGLLAGAGLAVGLNEIIQAATEAEAVSAKLAASFKGVGGISADQIADLETYAGELQQITRAEGDQILRAQAMLGTFNITSDSAKALTMSMLDMAEGASLNGAGMNDLVGQAVLLGKALTGQVGVLSRVGVTMTDAQKKAIALGDEITKVNTIIEVVNANFGGAALAMGGTFAGAAAKAKNNFGDLLEELGFIITQNGAVRQSLNELSNAFLEMAKYVKENKGFSDGLTDALIGLAQVGGAVVQTFNTMQVAIGGATSLWLYYLESYQRVKATFDPSESNAAAIDATLMQRVKVIDAMQKNYEEIFKANNATEALIKRLEAAKTGKGINLFNPPTTTPTADAGKAQEKASRDAVVMAKSYNDMVLSLNSLVLDLNQAATLTDTMAQADAFITEQKRLQEERQTTINMLAESFVGSVSSAADIISGTLQAGASSLGSIVATQWMEGGADFNDALKAMLRTLIAMTVQAVALGLALKALKIGLGGLAGGPLGMLAGLVAHKGGLIESYHTGGFKLSRDEVPAKLQRGEFVINRRAMSQPGALDAANALNQGRMGAGAGTTIVYEGSRNEFHITAMDGRDVERVTIDKIIPVLERQERNRSYQPGKAA